jgi:rhodanese-related sulfurtransferase
MPGPSITRQEIQQLIEDGNSPTIVETLRTEHFEQGHLPGAIHIHFEAVEELAPVLLPDKDAAIVTYCSNLACQNSGLAQQTLESLGYTNVSKYGEGKEDWENAGLGLETGAAIASS